MNYLIFAFLAEEQDKAVQSHGQRMQSLNYLDWSNSLSYFFVLSLCILSPFIISIKDLRQYAGLYMLLVNSC